MNLLPRARSRAGRHVAVLAGSALVMAACGQSDGGSARSGATLVSATTDAAVFDASLVHDISVEFDQADYDAMVATFDESGEKEWISASVTIDGTTFEDVGLRLKGNSSLRSVGTDSDPAEIPWLITLDEFVEGQSLDGYSQFVVRSNTSETALNEAVALDLLEEAGLAGEHAVATRFSVNGGAETLRLVVQNLDSTWDDENFPADGVLFKAEAGGDYSYRGEDPAAYEGIFDQETDKDEEHYEPLIDFLEFVNNADDETFAAELGEYLDVDEFATYLAFEDLIANGDDIDGPGNNSYLRYDEESGRFTVVAWDHNGAFGGFGMGGGAGGARPDGAAAPGGMERPTGLPDGVAPPDGAQRPGGVGGGGAGGPGGGSNVLVERFMADATFGALYEQATADLTAALYDSGTARSVLDTWVAVLSEQAGDLVDDATIDSEASRISAYLEGEQS